MYLGNLKCLIKISRYFSRNRSRNHWSSGAEKDNTTITVLHKLLLYVETHLNWQYCSALRPTPLLATSKS